MNQHITLDQADIIWAEIEKAKNILLHLHPSPDGDSVGSVLGMAHVLASLGKKVTVIKGDSELPVYLSQLPGFASIVQKNFFEVSISDFDLFLILDTGSPNQISKLKEIIFPLPIKTIVIDHHKSNQGFADINLIDTRFPATSEVIFNLLKTKGIQFSHGIALNLFVGIYTDTGGFKYKPVSANTLAAAAELAAVAPDFPDILFTLENSNTRGRLMLEGLLLTSIETYFSDSVAMTGIAYTTLQQNTIAETDAIGIDIANVLKSVIGWNIGISLIEREPEIVKLGMRSRDGEKYDVSTLALQLGGGGHPMAAGAQIQGTLEEAKDKVIKAIRQVFPDLKETL